MNGKCSTVPVNAAKIIGSESFVSLTVKWRSIAGIGPSKVRSPLIIISTNTKQKCVSSSEANHNFAPHCFRN